MHSTEKNKKRYIATDTQLFWGTETDRIKKQTGLYFSYACIADTVLQKDEMGRRVSGMIRRHPALRSIFFKNADCGYQTVEESAAFELKVYDLCENHDDIFDISKMQESSINQSYTETLDYLSRKEGKLPIHISQYRITDKSAVYVFIMDHSVSDGIGIRIIANDLLSKDIDVQEDHYMEYLDFLERKTDLKDAGNFWNQTYENIEYPRTGEFAYDVSTEKIILGNEIIISLQESCEKDKISAVGLILYAYAKAMLHILHMDGALFSLITSGRRIPVCGIEDTVGCFVRELPVYFSDKDSPSDFKRRYREAERYSYVPDEIKWKTDRNHLLKLPVSEVFYNRTAPNCREYIINDYEHMPLNSFIIKEEDGLHIYLHRDTMHIDRDEFHRLADEMRRILLSFIRENQPRILQSLVQERIDKYQGPAVVCDGRILTYEELSARAKQISASLYTRGIRPGDKVIVHMNRSEKQITALYGIFLSGAAAVPVNLDVPEERLKRIKVTSGSSLVFTDEFYDELLNEQIPEQLPMKEADEDAPAVVIYTSGSTGVPKGVCHTQLEEAVTFLQFPAVVDLAGFDTGRFTSVISRTGISYNLFYHLECPVLLQGKKLILLSENEQNDAQYIAQMIQENKHPAMVCTPSLLEIFLENKAFHDAFSDVETVVLAGEAVNTSLKKVLNSFCSHPICLNLYGSTECQSILWSDVNANNPDGIPLPDTEVCIVKDDRRAAAGEICVFSDAVSHKCVNGEILPHVEIDGRMFLRTGDGGMSVDGRHFRITGRLDRCIKLHGQRIDPVEIEQYISRIDGVDECVAVLKTTDTNSEILAVYYRGNAKLSAKMLREDLGDKLPGFMIPTIVMKTDVFPVTENGKTDYRALERMPITNNCTAKDIQLNEKEILVAKAAADTLGIDFCSLSAETEISQFGMDSLKILTMVSLLQNQGWNLHLNDFYLNPTICGIADMLEVMKRPEDMQCDEYISTPVQSYWAEREQVGDRINGLYVLRIFIAEKIFTEEDIKNRIRLLSKNHPALRAAFIREADGSIVQRIKVDRTVSCEYKDIRSLRSPDDSGYPGKQQENFLKAYAYQIGARYLGEGSNEDISLHVSVLTLGEKTSALIILLNHCNADGISEQIILHELLSPEPGSREDGYREYMAYVSSEENRQLARNFWKDYLKDACPAFVPLCTAGGNVSQPMTKTLSLDVDESIRFRDICRKEGFSVSIMMNYLYGKALLDVLGEESIIFEVLFHGRNLPVKEQDYTVGCLTQRLCVVIKMNDDIRRFVQSMSLAGSNGYIPREEIFYAAWNKRINPPVANAVVADINPVDRYGCACLEYNPIDREYLQHEHYLVDRDEGIRLIFHYDASIYEGSFYDALSDKIKTYIHGMCENGE